MEENEPGILARERLAKAAPDLLAAVEQVLDDMGEEGLCCCAFAKKQLIAAYEKATGRRAPT